MTMTYCTVSHKSTPQLVASTASTPQVIAIILSLPHSPENAHLKSSFTILDQGMCSLGTSTNLLLETGTWAKTWICYENCWQTLIVLVSFKSLL